MGRAKLLLTLVLVLVLGAGLASGVLLARWPFARAAASPARTPLAAELGLSEAQARAMREIWEEVRDQVDSCFARAQETQRRREAALLALLNEEQKAKFARAQQDAAAAMAALKAERDAAFQAAVRRTEQLLSEPQKKRYREILSTRLRGDPAGDGPDGWTPAPPSRPAAGR